MKSFLPKRYFTWILLDQDSDFYPFYSINVSLDHSAERWIHVIWLLLFRSLEVTLYVWRRDDLRNHKKDGSRAPYASLVWTVVGRKGRTEKVMEPLSSALRPVNGVLVQKEWLD